MTQYCCGVDEAYPSPQPKLSYYYLAHWTHLTHSARWNDAPTLGPGARPSSKPPRVQDVVLLVQQHSLSWHSM